MLIYMLHALAWSVSQNLYWIRIDIVFQSFLQPAIRMPNMSANLGLPETDNSYRIPKATCQENGVVIQTSFSRDFSPAGSKMGFPFMTTSNPGAATRSSLRGAQPLLHLRMLGQVFAAWSPL